MAAACSQAFNEVGAYKFYTPVRHFTDQEEEGFPPVRTEILSVVASYLVDAPAGVFVHTQFATLSPNMPSSTEIADLYEVTVGNAQSRSSYLGLLALAVPEFGNEKAIKQWCVDTARRNRKRLIAAHFVGRTVRDNRLVDAMSYPTELKEELPLFVRDLTVALGPYLDSDAEVDGTGLDSQEKKEIIKRVLRGDAVIPDLGAIAASSFLPSPGAFRTSLTTRLYPPLDE
jgi:hypothetical protein